MIIDIPYGEKFVKLNIDDENLIGTYYPNKVEKQDFESMMLKKLKEQYFEEYINTDEKIVFIVNDGTRPTPTAKILSKIYKYIKDKNIIFIIATGVHRKANQDEYKYIFGEEIYEELKSKNQIHCHDARNDKMVYLGISKNGTEMYINEIVAKAKKVVVIGSVEPHYFAGYTGGRKGFLPGVASYKTIEQNHKLALSSDAKALKLKGNPVHEDMMDAMKVLKDIDVFAIMSVLDREHDVYAITCGGLEESFYDAIEKANEVFCVEVPEKADIVISAAPYPMDFDLYQSQKAMDNAKLALKKNGILIMVSKCRNGIGEEAFYELLASEDSSESVLEKIKSNYVLGYHKAAKMSEINLWAETWAVTDLEKEIIEKINIKAFNNLKKALNAAIAKKGSDAKVVVLPYGSLTIPKI